jgi:hypothetical protein
MDYPYSTTTYPISLNFEAKAINTKPEIKVIDKVIEIKDEVVEKPVELKTYVRPE